MEGTNDETTVLIPPENKHSGVDGIDNNWIKTYSFFYNMQYTHANCYHVIEN